MWAHDVNVTRAVPVRTDVTEPPLTRAELKTTLFERQSAVSDERPVRHALCAGPGCDTALPIHLLEIDRIRPGVSGGEYALDNTQLLCGWCNRVKGNRDMEFLASRIARRRQGELEP